MDIIQKLDQLDEFMCQKDVIDIRKRELVDTILTPEIKAQLDEIEAEFALQHAAVDDNIAALTAEIKADVLATGATVKGAHLQAVYSKGRVSWDSKMLDGMIALVPQLAQARKEGEPSISIRKVG